MATTEKPKRPFVSIMAEHADVLARLASVIEDFYQHEAEDVPRARTVLFTINGEAAPFELSDPFSTGFEITLF